MREELSKYAGLAKFLKDALGERYEVVLRSTDDLEQGLAVHERALVNEGREFSPEVGILYDILNSVELKKRDYLCGFSDAGDVQAGKKDSYFYIRDDAGQIIGFLCIYEKVDDRVTVREVFEQVIHLSETEDSELPVKSQKINDEIDAVIRENIEKIWVNYKTPDKKITKADKLEFMREMLKTGMCGMKGSVPRISEVTGISQASIYRYLGQIVEE